MRLVKAYKNLTKNKNYNYKPKKKNKSSEIHLNKQNEKESKFQNELSTIFKIAVMSTITSEVLFVYFICNIFRRR